MTLPAGADIPTFLLSDGRLTEQITVGPDLRVGELLAKYLRSIPRDTLEKTTIGTFGVHMRHIERLIGGRVPLQMVTKSSLQEYVTARSREPGRREFVSAATIRKEVATFGSLWSWAASEGFVDSEFPKKGLLFPKQDDKPPFQTWEQIRRQIGDNHLTDKEASQLWDCLYLDTARLKELLEFIRTSSRHECLHPMCALAAFTGARRSELCRSHTSDIDLTGQSFTIRERKRSRSNRTTRTVPISDSLGAILEDWLASKPASRFTFPEDHRSLDMQNPDSEKLEIKPFEASNFLNSVLSGSNWETVRGWHVFRHSFISNCASQGVDQRFIDEWVGHQTDEQRRRYRHLFPDSQIQAINAVFR